MKTRIFLIILSALFMALSFHPLGVHFLAWFSLVPLLFAIDGKNTKFTFKSGIIFGFLFSLMSLFWLVFLQIETNVKILMLFGLLLLFLYIGLYFGVCLLIAKSIGIWFLPLAIVGLEFIRGLGELGFPWLSFGYSQARYPIIIQQASIYGIYGVSLWLVLLNVSLYKLIKECCRKYIILTALIFVLPLTYGLLRLKQPTGKFITIGIVQPNIDPNLKFTKGMREVTFDRLINLSFRCAELAQERFNTNIKLIVWPETAIPLFLKTPSKYQDRIFALSREINVPIFTGTPIFDSETHEVYNGAILIEPGKAIEQEYRKIHLVPFGEHIPFDRYIPAFRNIDLGEGDYAPGKKYMVFTTGEIKFSCLICFESIFPELSREFVKGGADLLLNITNDGWFGKISGPQQHNDMAILRTVENGVPLARSSNTGISMIVDQYGRILKETKSFEEDLLVCQISVNCVKTIYQRLGDIVPILSLFCITFFLSLKLFKTNHQD